MTLDWILIANAGWLSDVRLKDSVPSAQNMYKIES